MQKIPIVWHIREVIPVRSWIGRQLARIICMLSNRIIATSTTVAEPFEMCSEEKKALIPNAVDLDEFDLKVTAQRDKVRMQWDVDSEDFAVGIIGSVQEVKGHFVLLDAARRLREEGRDRIRFIVVAGGVGHGYAGTWKGRAKKLLGKSLDNLEQLQASVQEQGLQSWFRWVGFQQDIPAVMAGLDLLAFPSKEREGFGRPIIEAMAMQRPVIASNIGPTMEIMGPDAGLAVAPGDPEALAQHIVTLQRDPELRTRMGKAGRERVEERFSLVQQADQVTEVYRSVLRDQALEGTVQ